MMKLVKRMVLTGAAVTVMLSLAAPVSFAALVTAPHAKTPDTSKHDNSSGSVSGYGGDKYDEGYYYAPWSWDYYSYYYAPWNWDYSYYYHYCPWWICAE